MFPSVTTYKWITDISYSYTGPVLIIVQIQSRCRGGSWRLWLWIMVTWQHWDSSGWQQDVYSDQHHPHLGHAQCSDIHNTGLLHKKWRKLLCKVDIYVDLYHLSIPCVWLSKVVYCDIISSSRELKCSCKRFDDATIGWFVVLLDK